MNDDELYMTRALDLAEKGRGYTGSNPLVGSVLVKDGRVIAEGYHQCFGGPHAEINALRSAGNEAEGSTLYVTLEPCSHHGKTPPCCEAVAKAGVKRVVCAVSDPNPLVNGKGLAYLQGKGIEISCGVLATEAQEQNEIFFHFIKNRTPFVILKTAMSLDGKIATKTGESRWITSSEARAYVHGIRSSVGAIMVGVGTVLKDDPLLTTRTSEGEGRNPVRIVMDSNGRTPLDARLFKSIDEAPLLIVATPGISAERIEAYKKIGAEVLVIQASDRMEQVRLTLQVLSERGISSILLEGGGTLAESFIRAQAVQKVMTFIAPIIIGGAEAPTPVEGDGIGVLAASAKFSIARLSKVGCDVLIESYPRQEDVCLQA